MEPLSIAAIRSARAKRHIAITSVIATTILKEAGKEVGKALGKKTIKFLSIQNRNK